ncbi:MAG: protein-export chaperone SecB [Alphaproteobacteria bacterium]|nr:protein-export chaperone SecB [Alphaproteobacteria bacterium]
MAENETKNTGMIQINAQYVKDLSFEGPALPMILSELKGAPSISVDIDVKANRGAEKMYLVDLTVKTKAVKPDDQKVVFICELTYGGLVTLDVPPEHVEPLLLVEIPHLLFPYARAIIANTTREAGLPPLQINPVDFAALYRQRVQNQKPQA